MNDRVTIEVADGIATVSLNRPEKHNGLDIPMFQGLMAAARSLRRRRDVRVVILRGEGPSFCSGLDVASAFSSMPKFFRHFATLGRRRNIFQDVGLCWREVQAPVIAVIHGNCFGGGLQIALGADFRIAAPDAKLSVMEIKWGLIPDMSGTVLLRELMPLDQAKLLTLSGRVVNGSEARALNLVTEVAADPLATARALAQTLLGKSPDAVAAGKQLLNGNWLRSENKALAQERKFQLKMFATRNQRIAAKANQKQEAPRFRDRQFDY
jgi:enoyl-CoA hydratase/carnithine racemase